MPRPDDVEQRHSGQVQLRHPLNPLIAAAAMSLSSVLVVQNSLRLQSYRSKRVAAPSRDEIHEDELLAA